MTRQAAALEFRRRILQVVAQFPGIHVRELARLLDRSQAITGYHVAALAADDLLRIERQDAYMRLFATGDAAPLSEDERRVLGLLRERQALHIALFLLQGSKPARHTDIAAGTGIPKPLLSFHLDKLVAAGVVLRDGTLYGLADRRLVRRLMGRHQPLPDLREEFADLWDALYD